MAAAVFLDKDGTLIEDVPFNTDPARVRLAAGAGRALATLQRAGYRLFIVSNQPGIACGYFTEAALQPVWQRIDDLLAPWGATITACYCCPHRDGSCDCRKPQPGMLLRAAHGHGIDLAASWMVGDILHDVEAGRRAGCRTVLIENGNETEWQLTRWRVPDVIAPDLDAAAWAIRRFGGPCA